MTDSIDDKLNALLADFRGLLGKNQKDKSKRQITNIERLVNLGLTTDEAKAWLEQEPNFFNSRRIFTDKKNRRRLDRIGATLKNRQHSRKAVPNRKTLSTKKTNALVEVVVLVKGHRIVKKNFEAEMWVDGQKVPLNHFVQETIANVMWGFSKTLKGLDSAPEKIDVKIKKLVKPVEVDAHTYP